jgi:beta-phosphoglucomutase-like phosphatase (HAD superfamily)
MTEPLQLVILDCDGVLVDSERLAVRVETAVLAELGWPLGQAEVIERFEGRIFSASEVAEGKPAPDLFLHAAASLGAESARCAVVEDSRYGCRRSAPPGCGRSATPAA